MKAIRFSRPGEPEVLTQDEVPLPEPGPGEVRIRVHAAGVNYIDIYLRSGLYEFGPLPAILGEEGAGTIDAIGLGVEGFALGDPVAFLKARAGAYAEVVVLAADRVIPVPPALSLDQAAALPVQGLTAHYLTHTICPLAPGHKVLIHAAAGGVGLLAVQMAKRAGAEVFATCSSPAKADLVRQAGADHVIRYTEQNFREEVLRLTAGEGVDLAIDGVGKATFVDSVRATRVRGHIILFGQASGPPDPIQPRPLLGSRTLTCASLFDYVRERHELLERAQTVFSWVLQGQLAVRIDRVLALADAATAHRLLAGRETSGKLLLRP